MFDAQIKSTFPCEGKISYPYVGLVCENTFNFFMYSKFLNISDLSDLPSRSTNRFVLIKNHVLSVGKKLVFGGKLETVINITRFITKGQGESTSFDATPRVNLFKRSIIDAQLFTTHADNTDYLFSTVLVDKPQEDNSTAKQKLYFDPFDDRRLLQESSPINGRWLSSYVYDKDNLELMRISDLDFSEFSFIQDWQSLKITFLTRLASNRLIFMAVFDTSKVFLLATKSNSLAMSVVYHNDFGKTIKSLETKAGYLFILTETSVEICTPDHSKIEAIIAAFDNQEKTNLVNKDYLRVNQRIVLEGLLPDGIPLNLKVYTTQFNMIMMGVSSSRKLLLFGSHILQISGNSTTKSILSIFFQAGEVDFKSRILDFQLISPQQLNLANEAGVLFAHQIFILRQENNGIFYKKLVPICPPNHELIMSNPAFCKPMQDTSMKYMLGLQSNEVADCPMSKESSISQAYLCSDVETAVSSALSEVQFSNSNGSITCKSSNPEECFFSPQKKKVNCSIFTDCFNCSMVGSCAWTNEGKCDKFVSGNNTVEFLKIEENFLEEHLFETGYLALDIAALKIEAACQKRTDIPIKIESYGEFTNVSIGTDNYEEPMLVVDFVHREKRFFEKHRHWRPSRRHKLQC